MRPLLIEKSTCTLTNQAPRMSDGICELEMRRKGRVGVKERGGNTLCNGLFSVLRILLLFIYLFACLFYCAWVFSLHVCAPRPYSA